MDDRVVDTIRLSAPVQTLSIEKNMLSTNDDKPHSLHLVVEGAGEATVKNLRFSASNWEGLCDPFRRFEPRLCASSGIQAELSWQQKTAPESLFGAFLTQFELFGRNLKKIEQDNADAIAVVQRGRLFTAAHVSANIEVRRYESDGSITYDALVAACGDGFLSVTGIAIDERERAWIAGNTDACIPTTPNAMKAKAGGHAKEGFLVVLDTTNTGSSTPIYASYIADGPNQIAALRIDRDGTGYIAGTAESADFPHDAMLALPGLSSKAAVYGFIARVDSSSGGLVRSTLLPNVALTALALGPSGDVYATGQAAFGEGSDAVVAVLSGRGPQISYAARFGVSGNNEPTAVWAGSSEILVAGTRGTRFLMSVAPCQTGRVATQGIDNIENTGPQIAIQPALDSLASMELPNRRGQDSPPQGYTVLIGPKCPLDSP